MLKPLDDKVYITPIFDREITAGGIFVPDDAKERCDQGIVKYIGPEVLSINVGDHVLFPNYSGTLMNVEGEGPIIILEEKGITAVFHELQHIEVPGLYYKDKDGNTFNATYESAVQFLTKAIQETDWYKKNRDTKKRKTVE